MNQLITSLLALGQSKKFENFVRGVDLSLPDGRTLHFKIAKVTRSLRPPGLKLAKYSYVTEVVAGEFTGFGFGEAESKLLAFQKSIAEGVERAAYRAMKATPQGTPNSNGWSAHLDLDSAKNAALEELLERDATLVHWLSKKPMTVVSQADSPKWFRRWLGDDFSKSQDFQTFRILVSDAGFIPTVSTVLLKKDFRAVISHASAKTLEEAVYKALTETCRIAHIALENSATPININQDTFSPIEHALLYEKEEIFPAWIFGDVAGWKDAATSWEKKYRAFNRQSINATFHQVVDGPLVVGYCTSEEVQNLYFGRTEHARAQGMINVRRLNPALRGRELNLAPHCIA